tara:strand:- start:1713 stop:2351 length:639 start_codon:yes stop_codon:yes gene_type:complete
MSDAEIDIKMPDEELPEPGDYPPSGGNAYGKQPSDPLAEQDYDSPDEDADEEPVLSVKEIVPDEEVFLDPPPQAAPKKEKVKKPRKPPSEKQLAHLAKIRVKALEAKKAKQAPKKVVKAQADDDYEVVEEPKEVNKVGQKTIKANGSLVNLSQDDLRQLQYEAIHGYDTMRKKRKEEKKVRVAKEQHDKKVYSTISKAINPSADDAWGVCFQ